MRTSLCSYEETNKVSPTPAILSLKFCFIYLKALSPFTKTHHTLNFSLRSIIFWVSLTDLTLVFSIPVSVLTILTPWQLCYLSCCKLINSLSFLRSTASYLSKPNTASQKRSLHLAPWHLSTALVGSTRLPPCQNLWTAGTLGSPVLQSHISRLGNFALQTLAQRLTPNERKLHLLAERNTPSVLGSRWFSTMNMPPTKPWMLKQESARTFGHSWKCSRFPPTINFTSLISKYPRILLSRRMTISMPGPLVSVRTTSPRFVLLSLKNTTSAPMDGAPLASLNRGIPKMHNSCHHDILLFSWMKKQPSLTWKGILLSISF